MTEPDDGTTRVLAVDPEQPDRAAIAEAAAIVRAGGIVAFPTETVYGLGGSALDARAIERIYEAKGRPKQNPLIVHVLGEEDASRVVLELTARARRLIARFWPGPLTLVLARRAEVPALVSAGLPTVAVRSPAHPVARALIAAAGVPIAAPSANRSNAVSPTTAAHVLRSLGGRVPLVLDAGPCAVGLESTVLDLTGDVPRVLRPGHVTAREIADELAEPVAQAAIVVASDLEARVSPGTSARHYAPRARVEVVPRAWLAWRVRDLRDRGLAFRVIARGALPEGTEGRAIGEEPAEFARGLYAALHALDEEGVERIVVEAPPRGDERWAAVRDRLARAASDGEGGAGA